MCALKSAVVWSLVIALVILIGDKGVSSRFGTAIERDLTLQRRVADRALTPMAL
jgi:hypothetical protein